MRRITLFTIVMLLALSVADAQEAKLSLTRVNGIDGKPWPIRKGYANAPEIETFDGPYVLTPGTPKPALWFLDGATCVPVIYSPPGKRLAAFEVRQSGGEYFLTYVTDGVNEFWRLQGDKATQVTLNGKPFSQRARLTAGGDSPLTYHGDSAGKTRIYEIKDGAAVAVPVDNIDHGTISYAWQVGGFVLAAFYLDGTYDFHVLKEGKFAPAWARNGEKDYDRQVDSIRDVRAGDRLFLEITSRDHTTSGWLFDGAKLQAVKSWGKDAVANDHGAYFISDGTLVLADGTTERKLKTPAALTSLQCRGGSVLANGQWLIRGEEFVELAGDYKLLAYVNGADILRGDGKLEAYRDGKLQAAIETPAEFGTVESTWQVGIICYMVEQSAGEVPAFRLWALR